MPGPTTEVLNEDVRELKTDIREIRSDLGALRNEVHGIASSLTDEIHGVALQVAQLSAEFRVALNLAKWAGTIFVGVLLSGGVSANWWASAITTDVKRLSSEVAENRKAIDDVRLRVTPAPSPRAPDVPAPKVDH